MGVYYGGGDTTMKHTFIHMRVLPVIQNKEVINYEVRPQREVTKERHNMFAQ